MHTHTHTHTHTCIHMYVHAHTQKKNKRILQWTIPSLFSYCNFVPELNLLLCREREIKREGYGERLREKGRERKSNIDITFAGVPRNHKYFTYSVRKILKNFTFSIGN